MKYKPGSCYWINTIVSELTPEHLAILGQLSVEEQVGRYEPYKYAYIFTRETDFIWHLGYSDSRLTLRHIYLNPDDFIHLIKLKLINPELGTQAAIATLKKHFE